MAKRHTRKKQSGRKNGQVVHYSLWDRPSSKWSKLEAGPPLTKAELKQLAKEIEDAREEERKKNPWLGADLPVKNPHKIIGAVC